MQNPSWPYSPQQQGLFCAFAAHYAAQGFVEASAPLFRRIVNYLTAATDPESANKRQRLLLDLLEASPAGTRETTTGCALRNANLGCFVSDSLSILTAAMDETVVQRAEAVGFWRVLGLHYGRRGDWPQLIHCQLRSVAIRILLFSIIQIISILSAPI